MAAECRFCIHFGREVKPGSKRARTTNVKYFKHPFRADNYTQHMRTAHPEHWKAYEESSKEEKKTFFDEVVPIKKTLHAFFG